MTREQILDLLLNENIETRIRSLPGELFERAIVVAGVIADLGFWCIGLGVTLSYVFGT